MPKKKKRLVVRTPELVVDNDILVGSLDECDYFCLYSLLEYFDIPRTAKRIHVEASRSPWPEHIDRIESVRFRVIARRGGESWYRSPHQWRILLDVLDLYLEKLGFADNKPGYVYVLVRYSE